MHVNYNLIKTKNINLGAKCLDTSFQDKMQREKHMSLKKYFICWQQGLYEYINLNLKYTGNPYIENNS